MINFISLFEKVGTFQFSHLLIMGDFNFPVIDYINMTVNAPDDSASSKFFDATQDMFLFQHVNFNTRHRLGNQPSTLDYIFTMKKNSSRT